MGKDSEKNEIFVHCWWTCITESGIKFFQNIKNRIIIDSYSGGMAKSKIFKRSDT